MNLTFREVEQHQIQSATLRARAQAGGSTAFTKLFVALAGDDEVGFLSVDLRPLPEDMEVYEIFVLAKHRRQGFGSFLLQRAENFARERCYSHIALKPKPIVTAPDKAVLVQWYRKCGYVEAQSQPDWMRKEL